MARRRRTPYHELMDRFYEWEERRWTANLHLSEQRERYRRREISYLEYRRAIFAYGRVRATFNRYRDQLRKSERRARRRMTDRERWEWWRTSLAIRELRLGYAQRLLEQGRILPQDVHLIALRRGRAVYWERYWRERVLEEEQIIYYLHTVMINCASPMDHVERERTIEARGIFQVFLSAWEEHREEVANASEAILEDYLRWLGYGPVIDCPGGISEKSGAGPIETSREPALREHFDLLLEVWDHDYGRLAHQHIFPRITIYWWRAEDLDAVEDAMQQRTYAQLRSEVARLVGEPEEGEPSIDRLKGKTREADKYARREISRRLPRLGEEDATTPENIERLRRTRGRIGIRRRRRR